MKTSSILRSAVTHAIAIGTVLILAASQSSAVNRVKANNESNLNLPASWTNGVPASADIGVWDSTITSNNVAALGADTNWAGISIQNVGGSVTINGANTLTLGASGIDMTNALEDLTLDCNVKLNVNQNWFIVDNMTNTVGGVINGNAKTLTKDGNGTLVLAGSSANTNLSVTVDNGTLLLANTSGNAVSNLTLNTATLTVASLAQITATNGDQIANAATVTLNTGTTFDLNGFSETIGNLNGPDGNATSSTGAATLTLSSGTGTFGGSVSGSLAVVKSGSGTETFTGGNSYTGPTAITGGTLSINSDSALGASGTQLTINGGTLNASANMDISDRLINLGPTSGAGSGTFNVSGGATLSYSGSISNNGAGTGNLVMAGGGTFDLNGTNEYTGTTTVSGGTLQVDDGGWLGPNIATIAVSGTLAFDRSDVLNLNSQLTGAGTVAMIGGGTLGLAGSTANGVNATISSGMLILNKTGAAACNNLTVNGGTAQLSGTGGNQINGSLTINGGGVFDMNGKSETVSSVAANDTVGATFANSNPNTTSTLTGSYVLNAPGEIFFNVASGSTLELVSSGTPSSINGNLLDATGSGTTILVSQSIDSLFGNFQVDSGATLQMGNGSGSAIPFGAAVADNGTVAFNTSANLAQAAAINGGGSLAKSGTGTVTLSGANSYSGNTTINAGSLALSAAGSIASSPTVTVGTGATFNVSAFGAGGYTIPAGQTIMGTGTVTGSLNVNSGAGLQPGSLTNAGTLTVGGKVTMGSGFSPTFNVAATPAGTSGLLQVNGALALSGNTVTINLLSGSIAPGTYRLVNYTGARTGSLNPTPTFNPSISATATIQSTNTAGQINLVVSSGGGSGTTNNFSGMVYNGDGTSTLTVSGVSGSSFHVLTSTNVTLPLAQWTAVPGGSGTVGGGGTTTVIVTNTTPIQFFRVSTP